MALDYKFLADKREERVALDDKFLANKVEKEWRYIDDKFLFCSTTLSPLYGHDPLHYLSPLEGTPRNNILRHLFFFFFRFITTN